MNLDEYKEKLEGFNSTQKYRNELAMLYNLVCPMPNDKICDIGCGIGTAVKNFQWRFPKAIWIGYDVHAMYSGAVNQIPHNIDKAYFMHSFSHIPKPEETLKRLHSCLKKDGEIVIITPNPEWIWKNAESNYKPDETVVQHYSMTQLKELFKPYFEIMLIGQFDSDSKKVALFGKDVLNERIFVKATKI